MKKALRIILIINAFALLPCAIGTILGDFFYDIPIDKIPILLKYILMPAFIVAIFLRCLFLPYIFLAFTTVAYPIMFIKDKKEGKVSVPEIIYFVLLTAVCILGVFSLEPRFAAAMGI